MPKPFDSFGIRSLPEHILDLESASVGEIFPRGFSVTPGWGDCDPAQIAYTARIPEWGLKAIENWYAHCLDANWFDINISRGIGTPFVSLACDFHSPVTPHYELDIAVFVTRLGNTSLSHLVEGFQNKVLCFSIKTTAAFVDAKTMTPISIPPNMRLNIENYLRHQDREFDQ